MDEPVKELKITRMFDAPIESVWRAWTDQSMIKMWWGPRGVTNPTCEWDARPGGKINIVMQAGTELGPMAGQKWPMGGTFKEVTPMSRLVYTSGALDDVKKMFIEQRVTVEFEALGAKTRMKLHIIVTNSRGDEMARNALRGMEMGFNQQTDKLGEFLQTIKG